MTTKLCVKCNKEFAQLQEINGKKHNLQRRKFCLECSPFKEHNTRDIRKPKEIYLHSRNYDKLSLDQKKILNKKTHKNIQKRRINRKIKLVKLFGGRCVKCNYDKNYSVLQFHHKDPSQKSFGLSSNKIAGSSWDALLKEAEKCELLCANCHAEHHYPQCSMV